MSEKNKKDESLNEEEMTKDQETSQASSEDSCENEESSKAEAPKEETPEEKCEKLEKENAELKDQLLRRQADFENYRKRMIQEKQDAFDYGNANLLKDLLDSLDNFDRTIEAAQKATDVKSIVDGMSMVSKSLVSMLETKYNLKSFGEKTEAFDPEIHEAIGMMEGDVESEQIGEVYIKGYKLKDKVIRHAKVMVLKPKA